MHFEGSVGTAQPAFLSLLPNGLYFWNWHEINVHKPNTAQKPKKLPGICKP